MASQTLFELPIIHFSKENLKPNTSSWIAACKDVRLALEEYGFFVAKYDGFSSELDKKVFDVVKELFDLPLETKTQNFSDVMFQGYVGQLPHAPLHESLGIPDATTANGVQRFVDLMWPSGNQQFYETILSYARLISQLEQMVDKMVFESYGTQKHYKSHVESTTYLLRPIKYSAPDNIISNNIGNIGTNIHTDKSFLTILRQTEVNGLEVQLKNGEWISVDVPPGSFVVMSGDAYQAWSNGRIHAARHQVIMKEDKERYCLALFSFNHGTTNIPKELVDSDHPLQFNPFDNFGLVHFYLNSATQMSESSAKAYCGVNVEF
ncbi:probable 2-oxoglutarate-dependent dioxygenase AOP1 [Olea europaea subsp. europaea]|uniref:Probable 2-oxoglutarate-dependent dioxygenase AOP1 n=1 Tax=Olea europaea subsp. europaea TaxID=158383 RepID=A0A8S0PL45_OLEEU|nr:probable 2-oxoglutarate-dependent dioxygenase AOP1 [Olea europaea subsp. europaea]